MFTKVIACLVLFSSVFCSENGDKCITPNGEISTCQPLGLCDHIFQAVLSLDTAALDFAKKSQCDQNNPSLICCGNATALKPDADFDQSTLLASRKICGLDKNVDRIYGGQLTELNEFPWMVLLGYKHNFTETISFKCGGTLINRRYVLTAAHCVHIRPEIGIYLYSVRLGEWDVSSDKDCQGNGMNRDCTNPTIDVLIEKSIGHPKYGRRNGNHDVGLLRLAHNVEFSEFIQPVCLPFNGGLIEQTEKFLTITGWGVTELGTASNVKLKLEIPVISNDNCQRKFAKIANITYNQICAGGGQGKDACQGDSGGPLMSYKETSVHFRQWYQEGIISWGVGCGKESFPAIYTRVSAYLVWIIDNMEIF